MKEHTRGAHESRSNTPLKRKQKKNQQALLTALPSPFKLLTLKDVFFVGTTRTSNF